MVYCDLSYPKTPLKNNQGHDYYDQLGEKFAQR